MNHPPDRLKAILLALLVTFIWSTSWVFIKIGLREMPAITFAGLRYHSGIPLSDSLCRCAEMNFCGSSGLKRGIGSNW